MNNDLKCTLANSAKHFQGGQGGWFQPGDWALPGWWLTGLPVRDKAGFTTEQLDTHFLVAWNTDRFTLPDTV